MTDSPLEYRSITQLAKDIQRGAVRPVALTEHLLARIEHLNPKLNAFRVITRERALAEARAAEAALESGRSLGPLHGVPYAVKDLYDVKGEATTAGTRLLEDNIAAEDCTVVQKLSQAGMVLLGKTHTVQFAFGGVGINHDYGTPHNPWHADPHAPGGSSSGTAVALSAGLTPMALGSDTGGSVRIPASLCSLAGLKTTIGRISRQGVYPLSSTLDSVGPLARTVTDTALAYQAMLGEDEADPTTLGIAAHDTLKTIGLGVKGLRIAFCENLFFDDVDPEVAAAVREAGKVLASLGARVDSMEVPEFSDAFSFGQRALLIAAEACSVNDRLLDEHFDKLDPVVSHRMLSGRKLSAVDYYVLYQRWQGLRRSATERLRDVDALIVPTCQIPPRPLSEIDQDVDSYGLHNVQYLRNTSVGNILQFCGTSVPCGFTSGGLPIGLMVYAKPFDEALALRISHAYEQATDWHTRRPDLSWAEQG